MLFLALRETTAQRLRTTNTHTILTNVTLLKCSEIENHDLEFRLYNEDRRRAYASPSVEYAYRGHIDDEEAVGRGKDEPIVLPPQSKNFFNILQRKE